MPRQNVRSLRLPPPIEHRLLRLVCGAPRWLQRGAFGSPPHRDGQELEPDLHALLRLARLFGEDSVAAGHSPKQAREQNRADADAAAGSPLPMARVEPRSIPGPAGEIPARLYLAPSAAPPPPPLLVYFHGGGWTIGDLDTQDGPCRFLAAHSGVAVLSVDYRLAPEHPFPAAVEDALAAFRWAAESAAEIDVDPARIAVGGDSAGGNLAAAVSLLARGDNPRPAMQALIYPVTDATGGGPSRDLFAAGFMLTKADMEWFERHYLPEASMREDPRVSVLRAGDLSGLPPAYVATAGFDPLRDEGEAYAERMRAAGVSVALRRHPGLIHGFANMTAVSRSARAAMLELAGALRMGLAG
jgi:acetyl esterase